jgi:integrin beta 3
MDEKDYQALAAALVPVIRSQIAAAVAPLEAKIKELESREPMQGEPGPAGEAGSPGQKGEDGAPGKDGEAGPAGKDGAVGERGPAGEKGQDGAPGRDGEIGPAGERGPAGEKGMPGEKGADGPQGPIGKDGIGLAGALIDRAGELVVTLTDGSQKALGVVVGKDGAPGQSGKDGADALGFDDLSIEFDGEREFKFVMARGEVKKEFGPFSIPTVIDRGVWKEGAFKRGDGVTWGGSFWIAQEDTTDKPETSKAWRLAIKRGRDGRDGVMKAAPASGPVSVRP